MGSDVRLVGGVRWRCWGDGCVVFIPHRPATLLLSKEYSTLLHSLDVTTPEWRVSAERRIHADREGAAPELLQDLIELGIIESSG